MAKNSVGKRGVWGRFLDLWAGRGTRGRRRAATAPRPEPLEDRLAPALDIVATFDASFLNHPESAAIIRTINTVVATYDHWRTGGVEVAPSIGLVEQPPCLVGFEHSAGNAYGELGCVHRVQRPEAKLEQTLLYSNLGQITLPTDRIACAFNAGIA